MITSAICAGEALYGVRDKPARVLNAYNTLLSQVDCRSFDLAAARVYTILPFKRARFDRLIAAHALSLDAVLVTANIGDFADISGLKVENWAAE